MRRWVPVKAYPSKPSMITAMAKVSSIDIIVMVDSRNIERMSGERKPQRVLASGGTDGTVRLWESGTGQALVGDSFGMEDDVLTLAFSPDGRLLQHSVHRVISPGRPERPAASPAASSPTGSGHAIHSASRSRSSCRWSRFICWCGW